MIFKRLYLCLFSAFMVYLCAYTSESIDFLQSMLNVAQYTEKGHQIAITEEQLKDWHAFKELYEKYMVGDKVYAHNPRIPKIIHHIWLGSPLPARCKWFIETWKKHHPDWTFILWDDARVAQLGLINLRPYVAATNWGEKSDIVRYEILYHFGGLYVDTDFECLQPFDELHHCCDFYVGAYPDAGGGSCYVFNGLIGSAPGHPVLRRCIEGIQQQRSKRCKIPNHIMHRTGPMHLTTCLRAALVHGDAIGRCVPFPPIYFYAWPGVLRHDKSRQFIESFLQPQSLAVHHWAVSWVH
jgi:mannosyltransferase OCH1-like enzyme